MIQHSANLPDLQIYSCIPKCGKCPRVWNNEHIRHRIICKCSYCDHGTVTKEGARGHHQLAPDTNTRQDAKFEVNKLGQDLIT